MCVSYNNDLTLSSFHHFIIPSFHHFIIPSFHHSIISSLIPNRLQNYKNFFTYASARAFFPKKLKKELFYLHISKICCTFAASLKKLHYSLWRYN